MPRSHAEVEALLIKLEQSLKQVGLWADIPPAKEALESKVPFSFDQMPFEQWLQFIFFPKMAFILEKNLPLPEKMELLPIAEQTLNKVSSCKEVIEVIRQIDSFFKG